MVSVPGGAEWRTSLIGDKCMAHRVIIVGGGFAGLNAAKGLRGSPTDVTLFDRENFHLFQPLLYQVATGGLSPGDITAPIRSVLRNVPGRQGETVLIQACTVAGT